MRTITFALMFTLLLVIGLAELTLLGVRNNWSPYVLVVWIAVGALWSVQVIVAQVMLTVTTVKDAVAKDG